MKILVVGGGGREHAIIKKIKENPSVEVIYALPGNGGMEGDAVCVPIGAKDLEGVKNFALEQKIDYAVVAPDDPLVLGMVDVLTEAGIPVVVMEPVRGGRLASLSEKADAVLKEAHPDWSIASWAFRWLLRLDNVQVILSGMSTMDQIVDNVATFNTEPLSDADAKILQKACDMFKGEINVPCTGCRYCCDDCPMSIEIPKVMQIYNQYKLGGGMALMGLGAMKTGPKDCVGCGNCQKHCPQGIEIPKVMAELAEILNKMPGPRP